MYKRSSFWSCSVLGVVPTRPGFTCPRVCRRVGWGVWGWVRGGVGVGVEGGARGAVTWAKSKAKTTAPRFSRDAAGKPLRCRATSSRIRCGIPGLPDPLEAGEGACETTLRVV